MRKMYVVEMVDLENRSVLTAEFDTYEQAVDYIQTWLPCLAVRVDGQDRELTYIAMFGEHTLGESDSAEEAGRIIDHFMNFDGWKQLIQEYGDD